MTKEKFEDYYLAYQDYVIRIVMQQTGDYQAAQEICQKVFLDFYYNLETIAPDLVKPWLLRCTKNAVVDYFRKMKKKKAIFEEKPLHDMENDLKGKEIEHCEEQLDNRKLVERILCEIKKMNHNWYEVLELRCVEGLSVPEMSSRLCISETVLRARLHRARQYVRKEFGEEYF